MKVLPQQMHVEKIQVMDAQNHLQNPQGARSKLQGVSQSYLR